jgi:NAD(P)-dependent dehydrogenase (short-subunit alcohol dehydrogenase family)
MAMLLLIVITLVSFLNIESRLATLAVNKAQARMQAMVSLRLALAHLQQEAGPDRRTTARADITANTMQPGWIWT